MHHFIKNYTTKQLDYNLTYNKHIPKQQDKRTYLWIYVWLAGCFQLKFLKKANQLSFTASSFTSDFSHITGRAVQV